MGGHGSGHRQPLYTEHGGYVCLKWACGADRWAGECASSSVLELAPVGGVQSLMARAPTLVRGTRWGIEYMQAPVLGLQRRQGAEDISSPRVCHQTLVCKPRSSHTNCTQSIPERTEVGKPEGDPQACGRWRGSLAPGCSPVPLS